MPHVLVNLLIVQAPEALISVSSYKAKIESLNKNGLFDAATLYELFASEVCKLWFGQTFRNLNIVRSNYPYVDLVSEDEAIYVQVSTGQDIPGKVKSTLEKIRDSKGQSFSQIKTLYFFVLGNDSIDSVPEYTGEGRIGNIDFQPETHLISIAKIISKAATDLGFQQSLYGLLHRESETFRTTAEKFAEMLADSRALIQTQIDDLINGEYEISRDDLLSTIRTENYRNISVIGDAGSGKSALCKKLISHEDLVLFTRAEKIAEVADIDDIWGLGVRRLLRYLSGRRIVFYVDALEFIADGSKTSIDRLQGLYEATRDFDSAHVLTSCRTSDKNAFLRLMSTYEIQEYKVPELTDPEIAQIAVKYPIIRDLQQQNRYAELLKSPFYLNISEYDISVLCHLANCGVHVTSEKARKAFKAILHQMIEIWYTNDHADKHTDVINAFSESEMSTYLKGELINSDTTDLVIDMLFSETDYSKFVSDTYEFYEEVLIGYLPQYVDAYDNASERRRYKSITERIEAQVLRIPDEKVRIQLFRVLFLPSPKFYCGDWSNCRTTYSYHEKQFINSLWEKYGQYHLKSLLTAMYELHTSELLPEVLPAVCLSFSNAKEQETDSVGAAIYQNRVRINEIITTAFVDKEDQIKCNAQLTEAFESFLDLLIEFNVEMAAVILDEFRIH